MTQHQLHILGISGSLRTQSYNTALLRTARDVAPADVSIEIYEGLADIPHFNSDVRDRGDQGPVLDMRERIRTADALIIATPEYNFSLPGALKDALDWGSFPPSQSVLRHKPVAVMGASPSAIGTARAQLTVRQVLQETHSYVLPKPEVLVFRAHERVNNDGEFTDADVREFVRELIDGLVDWVRLVSRDRIETRELVAV